MIRSFKGNNHLYSCIYVFIPIFVFVPPQKSLLCACLYVSIFVREVINDIMFKLCVCGYVSFYICMHNCVSILICVLAINTLEWWKTSLPYDPLVAPTLPTNSLKSFENYDPFYFNRLIFKISKINVDIEKIYININQTK